jgi:hypothetical protein
MLELGSLCSNGDIMYIPSNTFIHWYTYYNSNVKCYNLLSCTFNDRISFSCILVRTSRNVIKQKKVPQKFPYQTKALLYYYHYIFNDCFEVWNRCMFLHTHTHIIYIYYIIFRPTTNRVKFNKLVFQHIHTHAINDSHTRCNLHVPKIKSQQCYNVFLVYV